MSPLTYSHWKGQRLAIFSSGYGGNAAGVGHIVGSSGGGAEAYLWTGPAGNLTNLHPTGLSNLSYSNALGTDGSYQVGYAHAPNQRAVLWSGTAGSAIDLHPAHSGVFGILLRLEWPAGSKLVLATRPMVHSERYCGMVVPTRQ